MYGISTVLCNKSPGQAGRKLEGSSSWFELRFSSCKIQNELMQQQSVIAHRGLADCSLAEKLESQSVAESVLNNHNLQ